MQRLYTIFLTPHSSLLTPHSSLLTPHSSLLTSCSMPLAACPMLERLHLIQLPVNAIGITYQLLMSAHLFNAAILNHHNDISMLNG